jgi:hypothetical protein
VRDNHQGYPEILRAYERNGLYFGVVRIELAHEAASFEFGVERTRYTALNRILQFRPFDQMPGVTYRYFFAGTYARRSGEEPVSIPIRVEQSGSSKKFEFDCPMSLASNLLWFASLSDLNQAAQLKRV